MQDSYHEQQEEVFHYETIVLGVVRILLNFRSCNQTEKSIHVCLIS